MNSNTVYMKLPDLHYYTCSETYHRWSRLFPRFYLTDGVKYVADEAGAYWLMDVIGSAQLIQAVKREPFQVWRLTVTNTVGTVIAEQGDGREIYRQEIEFTDFPDPGIELYATYSGDPDGRSLIILLPSEY